MSVIAVVNGVCPEKGPLWGFKQFLYLKELLLLQASKSKPYHCINFRLPGDIRRLARPGGAAQLLSSLLILLKGWISPVVMSSATLQTPCNPVFYALS